MNPGNIYFFNVNNSNTRKKYDICPKLKIKTPKHVILVFLLLTLSHLFLVFLLFILNK